jgi:hypothetical protein
VALTSGGPIIIKANYLTGTIVKNVLLTSGPTNDHIDSLILNTGLLVEFNYLKLNINK